MTDQAQRKTTRTPALDAKIQYIELHMLPIARTKSGFNYTYATLTEVLSHVNKAFKALHMVTYSCSNFVIIGDKPYNIFVVEIKDLDSGQHRDSTHIYPMVEDAQKVGSYETYFRRYSLISMLDIPIRDDDGRATRQPARRSWQPRHPVAGRTAR